MKRKGLLAVLLVTAAVLSGGLAAQYYTWSTAYAVNPLVTNSLTLNVGNRSGATAISPHTETEDNALKNLPNKVDLKFQIFADKDLDADNTNDLKELFENWYHFNVTFKVIGTDGATVVGSDFIKFTDSNGNSNIDGGEVTSNPAVITLDPTKDYDKDGTKLGKGLPVNISWTAEGETRALTSSTSSAEQSVPVAIYAAEK